MRPINVLPFALPLLLATSSAWAVGERDFIDSYAAIPPSVQNAVATVLPEASAVGNAYLSSIYDPNLVISQPATVTITFVHEGAGYKNTLGYFTYTTNGTDITVVDRQLIFPNASYADPNLGWGGGTMLAGDTATLRDGNGAVRTFLPGERIGFFIVANGWNGGGVKGWDPNEPALPYLDPATNASVGSGVYSTIDALNPEAVSAASLARHVAMIGMNGDPGFLGGNAFVLVGFEDLSRAGNSDEDFNDLVFVASSTPEAAIATTNVQQYDTNTNDPDNDGVTGLQDYFPQDPERATVVRTPATGLSSVAFEDQYPSVGDADYNDVVVRFALEEVLDSAGDLKELVGTFHLVARGAGFDHSFGLNLPGLPATATGKVRFERFASGGTNTTEPEAPLVTYLASDGQGGLTLRIDDVFPSTMAALPATNTDFETPVAPPASARMVVTFDTAIPRAPLGVAPFDPFVYVHHGLEKWDIHLPGKAPFADRPAGLPAENGIPSFVDPSFHPFAMMVPRDWRFPLEKVNLHHAYPPFTTWRSSLGQLAVDWYLSPQTMGSLITEPVAFAMHDRAWLVWAGQ